MAAERRGDPVLASASPVSRWLLVEQPGPWGRDALNESRLDRDVAARLAVRAEEAAVRVLLIRRPGRHRSEGPRRWALIDSRPGREECRWGAYDGEDALLSVPLDGSAGTLSQEPVYLVCAHGRHDTCCAVRGRPVAAMLAVHRPEATWECSHVGGDRFAGNLVLLPHGLYYGHMTAWTAMRAVHAYEKGQVLLAGFRGRSSLSRPVQAAQHYARVALGEMAVEAFAPRQVRALAGGAWAVRLGPVESSGSSADGDGSLTVTVVEEAAGQAAALTCSATRPARPSTFRLVAVDHR